MTPGLSEDIQCHVWPYSFLGLQITKVDISPQIKNGLSTWWPQMATVIFLTGLCGCVWVNMHPCHLWGYREFKVWYLCPYSATPSPSPVQMPEKSHLSQENSAKFTQVCRQLEPPDTTFILPGTHYWWREGRDRGSTEWELCLAILHMTVSGNRIQNAQSTWPNVQTEYCSLSCIIFNRERTKMKQKGTLFLLLLMQSLVILRILVSWYSKLYAHTPQPLLLIISVPR